MGGQVKRTTEHKATNTLEQGHGTFELPGRHGHTQRLPESECRESQHASCFGPMRTWEGHSIQSSAANHGQLYPVLFPPQHNLRHAHVVTVSKQSLRWALGQKRTAQPYNGQRDHRARRAENGQ